MYDINTQELMTATQRLLDAVANINKVTVNELTLAWGKTKKALDTMYAQTSSEPVEFEEKEEMEVVAA